MGRNEAIQAIIDYACTVYGITSADLLGHRKDSGVIPARFTAIAAVREITNLSYPEMGRRFGGRDHGTIINAERRAKEMALGDAEFSKYLDHAIQAGRDAYKPFFFRHDVFKFKSVRGKK